MKIAFILVGFFPLLLLLETLFPVRHRTWALVRWLMGCLRGLVASRYKYLCEGERMVDATQRHSTTRSERLLIDWLGPLWLCSTTLVLLMLSSGLLTHGAGAAERSRPIRIGALTTSWGPTPEMEALRDRLLELGYHEREDFVLGVRFTQGDNAALLYAARQLIASDVDLIFAVGHTLVVQAAQKATTRIPIVFAAASNPVEAGLIQSFAWPGSNTTGVSDLGFELVPKRLEIFREIIPGLKRVLFPYDAADPEHLLEAQALRSAARRLGIVLMEQPLRTEGEAKTILAEINPDAVDGILAPRCCSLNIPGFILETASPKSLPTMFQQGFWVEQGALASYGPDYYASGRQAARLVDKILKGANPAEIPVEVNPKIEFAINLKVSKALGLTIAPEVLFQADRIVR